MGVRHVGGHTGHTNTGLVVLAGKGPKAPGIVTGPNDAPDVPNAAALITEYLDAIGGFGGPVARVLTKNIVLDVLDNDAPGDVGGPAGKTLGGYT